MIRIEIYSYFLFIERDMILADLDVAASFLSDHFSVSIFAKKREVLTSI